MQFTAKVSVNVSDYNGESYYEEEFVTVMAENEQIATDKIYDHFNDKSDSYGTLYDVHRIEFFTMIY